MKGKKEKGDPSTPFNKVAKYTFEIRKENERHTAAMKKLEEKRDAALREYKQIRKKGG